MAKQIIFTEDARRSLKQGIDTLADAVCFTFYKFRLTVKKDETNWLIAS